MTMSTEYPDLAWVEPRSWLNANRTAVQCVVIHTTEGVANSGAAENGAAYDARRTDGTSTHYFHDNDSTIQCVRTEDIAYAARTQGNRRGIQHELCTRAGQAAWGDTYHQALLRRAAKQVARDCVKWDIPCRRISSAQLAAGVKGICGHVNVTEAFPQDGGTHTDPGINFPWSQFVPMVNQEIDNIQEGDVTSEDIRQGIYDFFAAAAQAARGEAPAGDAGQFMRNARNVINDVFDFSAAGPRSDDATVAKIDALSMKVDQLLAAKK